MSMQEAKARTLVNRMPESRVAKFVSGFSNWLKGLNSKMYGQALSTAGTALKSAERTQRAIDPVIGSIRDLSTQAAGVLAVPALLSGDDRIKDAFRKATDVAVSSGQYLEQGSPELAAYLAKQGVGIENLQETGEAEVLAIDSLQQNLSKAKPVKKKKKTTRKRPKGIQQGYRKGQALGKAANKKKKKKKN